MRILRYEHSCACWKYGKLHVCEKAHGSIPFGHSSKMFKVICGIAANKALFDANKTPNPFAGFAEQHVFREGWNVETSFWVSRKRSIDTTYTLNMHIGTSSLSLSLSPSRWNWIDKQIPYWLWRTGIYAASICCDRRSSSQVPDPKWPDLSRFGVHPFHHVSVQSSEMLKCFTYKFPGPILSGPIVDIYQPPANPASLSWAWDASSKHGQQHHQKQQQQQQQQQQHHSIAPAPEAETPLPAAWREALPKATATAATTATTTATAATTATRAAATTQFYSPSAGSRNSLASSMARGTTKSNSNSSNNGNNNGSSSNNSNESSSNNTIL